MHYDPRTDVCPLPFNPLKSCTVPRPIGWLGYHDYTVVREIFEMRIPGVGEEQLAGLEGKALG